MLVVWTPNAECRNSGLDRGCTRTAQTESNMNDLLTLAVKETNDAYLFSGVHAQLVLVHSELVQYTEASSNAFSSALDHISDATDGIIDDVHNLRSQYGADIVSMIIDDSQYCGLGYLGPFKQFMFSVTAWNCATGYYSFGHGKLIGLI